MDIIGSSNLLAIVNSSAEDIHIQVAIWLSAIIVYVDTDIN